MTRQPGAPESGLVPPDGRRSVTPRRRAESVAMGAGTAAVGLGVLGELAAPLWSMIPKWLHPVMAANEGMIVAGGVVLGVAALVRRARGRRGADASGSTAGSRTPSA